MLSKEIAIVLALTVCIGILQFLVCFVLSKLRTSAPVTRTLDFPLMLFSTVIFDECLFRGKQKQTKKMVHV